MAEPPQPCAHPRLDHLHAPNGPRGWKCGDCGESGPTVVSVALGPGMGPHQITLRCLCVCGSGWEWPPQEVGSAVAVFLNEHAECPLPEVVTTEPNAALYGLCAKWHPLAARTITVTGSDGKRVHLDVVCPKCEADGTAGLYALGGAVQLGASDGTKEHRISVLRADADDYEKFAGRVGHGLESAYLDLAAELRSRADSLDEAIGDERYARRVRERRAEQIARWQTQLDRGAVYAIPRYGELLHRWDCPVIPTPDRQPFYSATGPMKNDGTTHWMELPNLFTASELRLQPKRRRPCRICKPDPI